MQTSHLASVVTVAIVLTAVGIAAVAGPAAALDGDEGGGISPDPRTPNATDSQHNMRVTVEEGDAVAESGVRNITIDYGADDRFNGSVAGVSARDVRAFVNGSTIEVASVAVNETNDRLTITLEEVAPVAPGGSVIARVEGIANPNPSGRAAFNADVTLSDGANATSETTTGYILVPADLEFPNQQVPAEGDQNLTINGTVPNRGYIAVFTITDNGTAGDLLGVSPSIAPNFNYRLLTQIYPFGLNGNLTESQAVCAIPYYETTGGSQSIRARQSFNRTEDAAFRNDGVVINDTAVVAVEGSDAANVTAPATCRPRPENVVTANETNGSADNDTTANGTTDNGTANTTTPPGTTGTPALTTTAATSGPTTTGTPEPTTTETPTEDTTAGTDETTLEANTTTDETTETPTATATPEPTPEPTDTPTPESTTTSGNGPGFGIALALGGVLITVGAVLAERRR